MVPLEYSTIVYIQGFPRSFDHGGVHHIFGGNANCGYFPHTSIPIEWDYEDEIACVKYDEPLECVHARRNAFGGLPARIDSDMARVAARASREAGIEIPERFLLFATPNQRMQCYEYVAIRWMVPSVLEVPRFCVSSACSDQYRVEFRFPPNDIEMLRAALTLKPRRYDVFGFCTPDQGLFGAVEFRTTFDKELFYTDVFVAYSDRPLMVGDELWGWYTGKIGETQIQAKRLLAVVERVPKQPVPWLDVRRI